MEMISVERKCPMCGKMSTIICSESEMRQYENGALAQEAFAMMPLRDRETIISGMCYGCQEEFFSVEEDEGIEEICDGICDLCSEGDTCPNSCMT